MKPSLFINAACAAESGRSSSPQTVALLHPIPPFRFARRGLRGVTWVALLAVGLFAAPIVRAQVFWRVSIKVFTDSNGNRPSGRTDAQIQADYAYYNQIIANYARGCSFYVTEIVQLPASLNSWYNIQARNSANRDALLTAATGDPSTYAYRSTAINIYINNSSSGVCCGPNNGLIFVGNEDGSTTMFHETGHMLGLCHTQGCGCNGCSPDPLGACDTPGDDGISDTIGDLPCWSIDQISQNWAGNNFVSLSASQQNTVNNVWLNIMSYHSGLNRLTAGQMDEVAEVSNASRDNVTGNYFIFVDGTSGNDANGGLTASGSFKTVTGAITGSGIDDVLLLRAGTYNKATAGAWVINANRVLCSRKGTVRLTRQ